MIIRDIPVLKVNLVKLVQLVILVIRDPRVHPAILVRGDLRVHKDLQDQEELREISEHR